MTESPPRSRGFEDVFGRHIAALTERGAVAATLPLEGAKAAQERGRVHDLGAIVAELLVELQG